MCRLWYYNYAPLKLLRNKLVPNKNLVLPFLLESTNPTLTQPSPTSHILVGSSICCFSGSKNWRTIITTSTQTLAGSQDPIKTATYLFSALGFLPGQWWPWGQQPRGEGEYKKHLAYLLTLTSDPGDEQVCRTSVWTFTGQGRWEHLLYALPHFLNTYGLAPVLCLWCPLKLELPPKCFPHSHYP